MNNQMIDGGLRKLLEALVSIHPSDTRYRLAKEELRALLDAPVDPASALNRAWQAGYDTGYYAKNPAHERTAAQPQGEPVALTQDAIDRIVPSLNPEPDRDEFHCEWALWSDRERIRGKLSALLTANPAPVAVVLPERKRAHCTGAISDFRTWEEAQGWNACIEEVTRLNSKSR